MDQYDSLGVPDADESDIHQEKQKLLEAPTTDEAR